MSKILKILIGICSILLLIWMFSLFRNKEKLAISYFHKHESTFTNLVQRIELKYLTKENFIQIFQDGINKSQDSTIIKYMKDLDIDIIQLEKYDNVNYTIKFLIREIYHTYVYGWYLYDKINIIENEESYSYRIWKINDNWGFLKNIGL